MHNEHLPSRPRLAYLLYNRILGRMQLRLSKMAKFGSFKPGEKPNIQKLKCMMGKMQQQFSLQGGPHGAGDAGGQENGIFSIRDALETAEDVKDRLKTLVQNNPFDVFVYAKCRVQEPSLARAPVLFKSAIP